MTFQDIFRSSFIESLGSLTLLDMVIALVLALLLGIFIFFIYRRCYSGVMYSASFGISLIALCMITVMLIMTVVSNVVLSLGMVGALSIVRFRAAIKEPLDIVFLFWAIAVGIVLASGLLPLAVLGSLFIGLVLIFLARSKTIDRPYLLIVELNDDEKEIAIAAKIKANTKRMALKTKTHTKDGIELDYEVRLKDEDTTFINTLIKDEAIAHIALVSYNGDYLG